MPYKKNYKTKSRIKKKWRQQKLSVGTVAKIARKVAKRLDDANNIYVYSNVYNARDGFTWSSVTETVPNNGYRPILNGAMESQVISDLSNLVQDVSIVAISSDYRSITVGVKAVQSRICIRNPNVDTIRYDAQLVYIPNLNDQTDDGVDFLRPDVFMLYKNGGGNLLYDGIAKKAIRNLSTGASSVREYTILARKVGTLRGSIASGTDTAQDARPNVARTQFYLTKYFKRERKHNCKQVQAGGANQFTDGNYYLIIHSDIPLDSQTPAQQQRITYIAASSIKLRIIGPTQPITS